MSEATTTLTLTATKHLITLAYLLVGKLSHLPASPFKLNACPTVAA